MTSGGLKAIETRYKGYRFRSRLEARWAVFFDTLGVEFEYEKEGYELGDVRYLPDFRLVGSGVWVEIKPSGIPTPAEVEKAVALARASLVPVLIVSGSPWYGEYELRCYSGPALEAMGDADRIGPDHFGMMACLTLEGTEAWRALACNESHPGVPHGVGLLRWFPLDRIRTAASLSDAFAAARSARFEHGESGG